MTNNSQWLGYGGFLRNGGANASARSNADRQNRLHSVVVPGGWKASPVRDGNIATSDSAGVGEVSPHRFREAA